jgi:hypothetical protein
MNPETPAAGYFVWGTDQNSYGPVELPALISWIKDERVTAETWVFQQKNGEWQQAAEIPEFNMFFNRRHGAGQSSDTSPGLKPGVLRRVKILAEFTDEQLDRFALAMEVEKIPQWTTVVKQGDHGDTMFLVLEGELRVRIAVSGKETILATLAPGDFFGEISLFDHGPRSADVVANLDSIVLKISAPSLKKLSQETPDLAAPFLRNVIETLTARIRADNKRYSDSVKFARAAQ